MHDAAQKQMTNVGRQPVGTLQTNNSTSPVQNTAYWPNYGYGMSPPMPIIPPNMFVLPSNGGNIVVSHHSVGQPPPAAAAGGASQQQPLCLPVYYAPYQHVSGGFALNDAPQEGKDESQTANEKSSKATAFESNSEDTLNSPSDNQIVATNTSVSKNGSTLHCDSKHKQNSTVDEKPLRSHSEQLNVKIVAEYKQISDHGVKVAATSDNVAKTKAESVRDYYAPQQPRIFSGTSSEGFVTTATGNGYNYMNAQPMYLMQQQNTGIPTTLAAQGTFVAYSPQQYGYNGQMPFHDANGVQGFPQQYMFQPTVLPNGAYVMAYHPSAVPTAGYQPAGQMYHHPVAGTTIMATGIQEDVQSMHSGVSARYMVPKDNGSIDSSGNSNLDGGSDARQEEIRRIHEGFHSSVEQSIASLDHHTTTSSSNSMRRRAEAKRHKCSMCGKQFTRPSSLRTHVNSHTGERPFLCTNQGCPRTFSVLSNMRRHAKACGYSGNATLSGYSSGN